MLFIPTEAISASQMSKRSLPEMSYIDFSNRSMPFEFMGEEPVSMIGLNMLLEDEVNPATSNFYL